MHGLAASPPGSPGSPKRLVGQRLVQEMGQAHAGPLHPVPDDRRGGSDVGGVDHNLPLGLALIPFHVVRRVAAAAVNGHTQ